LERKAEARRLIGVAAAVLLAAAGCSRADAPARRDLVLITIDTLRADRLGFHGSDAGASPFLDSLAAESVVFENASATCPATGPATASLITGLHRGAHGVARNGSTLPEPIVTLAEVLRDAGYRTAGFVANPVLEPAHGFGQGFEVFELPAALQTEGPGRFAGGPLVDAARAWLAGVAPDAPLFLWIHFMDPHGDYTPPDAFRARFDPARYRRPGDRPLEIVDRNHGLGIVPRYQESAGEKVGDRVAPELVRARYDGEIAYADSLVASLVGSLAARPRWKDAVVVLSADHGESLGEHDFFFQHGWFAYEDSVRVPFTLRAPGLVTPRRVAASVSMVDLTPTLLDVLGLATPASMEGRSLLPVIRGDEGDRPAFSQTYYGNRQTSLRIGATKYIYTPAPPPKESDDRKADGWLALWPKQASEELYDLAADPGELANRVAHDPDTARALRGRLEAWLADQSARANALVETLRKDGSKDSRKQARRFERDLDMEEMLRSLGYAE
jgi:arylsulfatase A-like enzyme